MYPLIFEPPNRDCALEDCAFLCYGLRIGNPLISAPTTPSRTSQPLSPLSAEFRWING